jgi:DNA-binding NtrC family response regulator
MLTPDVAGYRGSILVVDDEANARNALSEILTEERYGVEMAADGFNALEKLGHFTPDVVLTDLKMPGMDGLELMKTIRANYPGISVIVMTAFGDVDTATAVMAHGASEYLTKPVDIDELLGVLRGITTGSERQPIS